MAGQETIWHVILDDKPHGPLTKVQVLGYLRDGVLKGSDLIWRPGFTQWTSVSEITDFWQPPNRTAMQVPVQSQTPLSALDHGNDPGGIDPPSAGEMPSAGEKWSIWN